MYRGKENLLRIFFLSNLENMMENIKKKKYLFYLLLSFIIEENKKEEEKENYLKSPYTIMLY